jgi:hypothetical protein
VVLVAVLSTCRSSRATGGRYGWICGSKGFPEGFEEVLTPSPPTRKVAPHHVLHIP